MVFPREIQLDMQVSTCFVFSSCNTAQQAASYRPTLIFFRSDPEPVLITAKGLLQSVSMLLEDVFLHAFKNLI